MAVSSIGLALHFSRLGIIVLFIVILKRSVVDEICHGRHDGTECHKADPRPTVAGDVRCGREEGGGSNDSKLGPKFQSRANIPPDLGLA